MKNTHECPKCNAHDIIRIPGPASVGYTQNKVPTGFFSTGNVDRYVCLDCGFTEEWIANEKDLEKVRKKYAGKSEDKNEFV